MSLGIIDDGRGSARPEYSQQAEHEVSGPVSAFSGCPVRSDAGQKLAQCAIAAVPVVGIVSPAAQDSFRSSRFTDVVVPLNESVIR